MIVMTQKYVVKTLSENGVPGIETMRLRTMLPERKDIAMIVSIGQPVGKACLKK